MDTRDHPAGHPAPLQHRTHRRARWVFGGFALIALALLFTEHRAHVLGILPWLFLLACPLMHLFMHHGHDHHGGREDGK